MKVLLSLAPFQVFFRIAFYFSQKTHASQLVTIFFYQWIRRRQRKPRSTLKKAICGFNKKIFIKNSSCSRIY